MVIFVAAVIGFLLSLYGLKATYTEKPWCDLSPLISCTKAFRHKKGRHFGIPNTVWGMVYYLLIVVAVLFMPTLVFPLAVAGIIASIYLAYELYAFVRSLCLVCTSTYIINIIIFLAAL